MMKKIVPIILVLSLVLTSFSLAVFAAGAIGGGSAETPIIPIPPSGGQTQPKAYFEYSFDVAAGTATITGFSGNATDIVIPVTAFNAIDDTDYAVVGIADGVFAGEAITSVTLHSGIQFVGENAFKDCALLENVYGTASLEVVGQNAFAGTMWFTQFEEENVVYIGKALYSYTGAEEWTFVASGTASITAGAFAANDTMKYLVIPASVAEIGEGAAQACTALEAIFGIEGSAAAVYAEANGIAFNTIPALIVKSLPEKTVYVQGEDVIDVTGGELIYLGEDMQLQEIQMEQSMVSVFDTSVVTPAANVTLTYNGASVSFQIEVTKKPAAALGDVDGDGAVNDWDGILMAQYLAGWDVEVSNLDALDLDADGEITDWDGVLLDRYLAGWDVKLG